LYAIVDGGLHQESTLPAQAHQIASRQPNLSWTPCPKAASLKCVITSTIKQSPLESGALRIMYALAGRHRMSPVKEDRPILAGLNVVSNDGCAIAS
jgi:hypothetical protein